MICRDNRGIVGVNLVLVIAFALYAVIMLSRTTLAAKQIDDRVRVIVAEVGPGSNVSRLDETEKLNAIGKTAEDILDAAKGLSGQAQVIIDTATSIDNTVSAIYANANEINATVHSINATASSLLPVVRTIHGDGSDTPRTGGVEYINRQAGAATSQSIVGIANDLDKVRQAVGAPGVAGHTGPTIHTHVNSINCALTNNGLLGLVGGVLNILGSLTGTTPPGCNT